MAGRSIPPVSSAPETAVFRTWWLYAVTLFASAFLLFQVQPLVGRYLLPVFGGTPTVWTVCMLFFQAMLLAGYAYAHWSASRLTPRAQVLCHLLVIGLGAWAVPLVPEVAWEPSIDESPVAGILGILAVTVGPPYFALAASAPLLQSWFGCAVSGESPYRLYAVSNAGSLLALLSYPFVVEPLWPLATQGLNWSWGYGLFALLVLVSGARFLGRKPTTPAPGAPDEGGAASTSGPVPRSVRWLWLALPACAVALFMATTHQLCQDVAVVPFLWVLPLGIYLLSFVLTFGRRSRYERSLFLPVTALFVVWVCWLLYLESGSDLVEAITAYSLTLFCCCMICHGELVRLRPPTDRLTEFYLTLAAGGVVGGLLVALVAPIVFPAYLEYQVALVALGGLIAWILAREDAPSWTRGVATFLVVLSAYLLWQGREQFADYDTAERNFYGVLRTGTKFDLDVGDHKRSLYHGGINHGFQYLSEQLSREPVSYYGRESGVGLAVRRHRASQPRRIGVVGLGVGVVAAYGKEGDLVRFYEINPAVERIARAHFRYLEESPARVEVVLGDARKSLERELAERPAGHAYDVLVLDAFSGDALPTHLLTREAFALYLEHLKPDGLLVAHISNRHFNLEPVIDGHARHFGRDSVLIETDDDDEVGLYAASWTVLTGNQVWLAHPDVVAAVGKGSGDGWETRRFRPWTDDYASLFPLLWRR